MVGAGSWLASLVYRAGNTRQGTASRLQVILFRPSGAIITLILIVEWHHRPNRYQIPRINSKSGEKFILSLIAQTLDSAQTLNSVRIYPGLLHGNYVQTLVCEHYTKNRSGGFSMVAFGCQERTKTTVKARLSTSVRLWMPRSTTCSAVSSPFVGLVMLNVVMWNVLDGRIAMYCKMLWVANWQCIILLLWSAPESTYFSCTHR